MPEAHGISSDTGAALPRRQNPVRKFAAILLTRCTTLTSRTAGIGSA
jgi:hypothetical protein